MEAVRIYVSERQRIIGDQLHLAHLEEKAAREESRWIAQNLERYLSNLGFDHLYSVDGKRERRTVHVDRYQICPDEYRYHIDGHRLPHGVDLWTMTDEKYVKSLEASIGCPIETHFSEGGLWFRVYRKTGLRNVPRYVEFEETYSKLKPSDGPLTLAVGLGPNRKLIKLDLRDDPKANLLIGGVPGGGKTNLMHLIICTLARRADPRHVKLVLVDLKRTEFKCYSYLPHLLHPVVRTIEEVLPIMQEMSDEIDKRMKILEQGRGFNKLTRYNAMHSDAPLPEIVVVFDEIAVIMLDPTYPLDKRKQFESMIAHIAQTGRAFGIHLILATQRPEETVIRPLIRGSINGRIAFATASIADSTLLVMNGDACFRDAVPPGRMIVSYGRHHVPAQCAFITQEVIDSIITNAEAGKIETRRRTHDVHLQDVIEWALREWPCPEGNRRTPGQIGVIGRVEATRNFSYSRNVPALDMEEMLREGMNAPFILDLREMQLRQDVDAEGRTIRNLPLRIIDLRMEAEEIETISNEPPKLSPEDTLRAFVRECCELDPNLWSATSDLQTEYRIYAVARGIEVLSGKRWGAILREFGCQDEQIKQKGKPIRGWAGLRLVPGTGTDNGFEITDRVSLGYLEESQNDGTGTEADNVQ